MASSKANDHGFSQVPIVWAEFLVRMITDEFRFDVRSHRLVLLPQRSGSKKTPSTHSWHMTNAALKRNQKTTSLRLRHNLNCIAQRVLNTVDPLIGKMTCQRIIDLQTSINHILKLTLPATQSPESACAIVIMADILDLHLKPSLEYVPRLITRPAIIIYLHFE